MAFTNSNKGLALTATVGGIAIIFFALKLQQQGNTTEASGNTNTSLKKVTKSLLTKDKVDQAKTDLRKQVKKVAVKTALPLHAIPNERIAHFENQEDYNAFIAELAKRGLTLLGKSDRLRAVRFGFTPQSNLDDVSGAEIAFNFLVSPPSPTAGQIQDGALGFGGSALEWLGLTSDNSAWGSGVTVAVIDSGVNSHIALTGENGDVSSINLTELNGSEQLGHGTAVASIISGDHALTRGVAPASDILSIRVTDDLGLSDSLTLAEGIIQAVDAGAQIVNMSLGSAVDSRIVSEAVSYAIENGVVLVASAGNDGATNLSFPAGNNGVISVGAVEAQGEHAGFSNTGDSLNIAAPGFEVNAAWGEDLLISFSGTSASAPYVSGAIAAALSEIPNITPTEAANIVLSVTNDAGQPGDDNQFGGGTLALDRIMEYNTAGVYDAAIAGQVISSQNNNDLLVTVQNQGTEPLINSQVNISGPNGDELHNVTSLLPGQIHTITLSNANIGTQEPVSVTTTIEIQEQDRDPGNNASTSEFTKDL